MRLEMRVEGRVKQKEIVEVRLVEGGRPGQSVKVKNKSVDEKGNIILNLTDGTEVVIPKGDKGDSIKIDKVLNQADGSRKIVFNDGSEFIVPKGDKGEKGDSISIKSQSTLDNGDKKIVFSDNTELVVPKGDKGDRGIKGDQGDKGETGEASKIIKQRKLDNGDIELTFNDNTVVKVPKGDKGDEGKRGIQGETGKASKIVSQKPLDNGNIQVTFNDNTVVEIPKGDKGESITATVTNQSNGDKKVVFSDGTEFIIPKGDKGDKGEPFKYSDFTKEQIEGLKASFDVKKIDSLTGTGNSSTLYVYQNGLYFWNGSKYEEAIKQVDISGKVDKTEIPKKLSELENDKTFKTDNEIQSMIDTAVSSKVDKSDVVDYINTSEDYTGKVASANIVKNLTVNLEKSYNGIAQELDNYAQVEEVRENSSNIAVLNSVLNAKVDKVDGKVLSTNDYTTAEKNKLSGIEAGAEKNKVNSVNGQTGSVNIKIPSKLSQLTNDKNYKTETEIQSMINSASSLKKEVVTSLPTKGKDDVIYLIKDPKGKDNNNYLEYLWINGAFELIGNTQVDLTGYAKESYVDTKVEGKVDKDGNKVLSDNNYTNTDKAKVDAIPSNPKYTDTTYDLSPYAKKADVDTKLGNKVDKVSGKTLSSNDFTNTHKSKLDNLTSTATGNEATTSNRGYMSASDKKKLNGIDLSKYVETGHFEALGQNMGMIGQMAGEAKEIAREAKSIAGSAYSIASDAGKRVLEVSTTIADHKRCIILAQSEYDALSSTEKNRADTLYFIKK